MKAVSDLDRRVLDFISRYKDNLDNNNFSRRIFWDNRDSEIAEYVFNLYREYTEFYKVSFMRFIRFYFLGYRDRQNMCYRNIEDFLQNYYSFQRARISSDRYAKYYIQQLEFVNFSDPKNFVELFYCFRNNLVDRPKCTNNECSSSVEFTVCSQGYRKYCSQKCQIKVNNQFKKPKLSVLTDDEIRILVDGISINSRSLTNNKIQNVYLNIEQYSSSRADISPSERIYLFLNKLPVKHTYCDTCGGSKQFKGQLVGYSKTCGRNSCVHVHIHGDTYYNEYCVNDRCIRGSSNIEEGFIYLLRIPNTNIYKIGITIDPVKRIYQIRKDAPTIEIHSSVYIKKGVYKLEQQLLKRFTAQQVQFENQFAGSTEFVELSSEDVQYIEDIIHARK